MSNERWSRERLLPAATYLDEGILRWRDDEKEKRSPRAKQRSTPPPAEEKLVWPPPPPSISDALYGESKPTVDGKPLSLDNLSSYFTIQEDKSEAVEKLKDLLEMAEPASEEKDEYGVKYGNPYGEKYGAVGERPDTMSFHTCSELCAPLLGAGGDFDECQELCNLIYNENKMAARGRTKRRKYKKTKKRKSHRKKKTHRKKKRTRKTRKR